MEKLNQQVAGHVEREPAADRKQSLRRLEAYFYAVKQEGGKVHEGV
ncbi:MAG: hypothetical protein LUE16_03755 [Lachnospiraceae bacterium]|nr:hypothetical protein [Lachnospiraceae bacterium]